MAMRIQSLEIDPPVLMAPMAGITDSPYRRLLRRLGCPAVVTEMVSAEGLVRRQKKTWRLLEHDPEERPLIVQLFGKDPAVLAEAAAASDGHGFAALDLNMGCPMRKVTNGGSGAALMRDPARAEAIVRAVRKATGLPLTVKFRIGWSDDEANAVEFARRVHGAGADAVTVHARTRTQGFRGVADWSWIRRVVEAVPIPVIGNGDLRLPSDGARMMAETGCAGVMVGRAAMGDPFLPAALAGAPYPPTSAQRYRAFVDHLGLLTEFIGSETKAVIQMRKQLIWYARGLRGVAELRKRIPGLFTAEEMCEAFRVITNQA